jgi:hypothetical protein
MEITIDIHGYTTVEAQKYIEKELANIPKNVKFVRIIHGYHSGDTLKEFVRSRNGIRSKKIRRKKFTMNQGETILELY